MLTSRIAFSSLPTVTPTDRLNVLDLSTKTRKFILKNEKDNLWWTRKSDTPYVWNNKAFRSAKKGSMTEKRQFPRKVVERTPENFEFPFVTKKSIVKASSCKVTSRMIDNIYYVPDTREVRTSYQTLRKKGITKCTFLISKEQQEIIKEDIQNYILNEQERKALTIRPISATSQRPKMCKCTSEDLDQIEDTSQSRTHPPEPFLKLNLNNINSTTNQPVVHSSFN